MVTGMTNSDANKSLLYTYNQKRQKIKSFKLIDVYTTYKRYTSLNLKTSQFMSNLDILINSAIISLTIHIIYIFI